MPLTSRHVIRIEEIRIGGMRRSIVRRGLSQNKGFEKPTGVCQMPFRGAHIGHRLNDIIFRHQRLAKPVGKLSHLMVTPNKRPLMGSLTETVEVNCAMNTVIDWHIHILFHLSSSTSNSSTQPRDSRTRSTNSRKLSM